ncbi:MAG: DUF4440 domain-containing protein [Labilithrix sp.]|nr:DUF4440 domain-containing protein [Labilithrix sp.]MCW5810180.1 DUF4440 domain-containing protein [Labilithrix sp.]
MQAGASTTVPSATEWSDRAAALSTFRRYTEAFRSLDACAVAAFFHAPAVMLTPRGDFALPTAAEVERTYARVMEDARARGYATTTFDRLDARRFGVGIVSIEGAGAWRDGKGNVIERFELSYVLRRTGGGWRIVLASIAA